MIEWVYGFNGFNFVKGFILLVNPQNSLEIDRLFIENEVKTLYLPIHKTDSKVYRQFFGTS